MKRISANHNSTDWKEELSDRHSIVWVQGIEILKSRFESRYLRPIEYLQSSTDKVVKYNSGFLIMSIDCLLIETLNQFFLGLGKTDEKYFSNNTNKEFKNNSQAFRDFFIYSSFFSDFNRDTKLYSVFYDEIRCGLLHQAASKTHSLINIREQKMISYINKVDSSNGLIVNRNIFHEALLNEFNKYLKDLENADSKNLFGEYLRDTCNRKMKDLCLL